MATIVSQVILVKDVGGSGDGISRDALRKRRHFAVVLLQFDHDSADVALGAPNIPLPGDPYKPGSFFLVIGRTAEVDKRNNFLVHVVIEYGINEEVVSILDGKLPPWERRDIVRPFTKTKMLPLYVSYDLTDPSNPKPKVVQNSAGQPFATPIMTSVTNLVLKIRRSSLIQDFNYSDIIPLIGSINAAPVAIAGVTYIAHQCMLTEVDMPISVWVDPAEGTETQYWSLTYSIEVATSVQAGVDSGGNAILTPPTHDQQVHNIGYDCLSGGKLVRAVNLVTDASGVSAYQPSALPVPLQPPLNADGSPNPLAGQRMPLFLADGKTPTPIPLLNFQSQVAADWTVLNFPVS